ncbi:hypothetical protein [Scytonema sp. NUACC26]|uniref:hypothetical protein n=1 Tax=Scytonema sp. NUACC26 TaxID=3140176 RepID=UPI0034DC79C0
MVLKRKKGYSIETKTARFTLLRDGCDLDETKTAFNELVSFYFAVVCTYPEGTYKTKEYYKVYEGLTVGQDAQYPIPNVRRGAYQRYAILTARVNPKNTSRLCAVNGVEVWRGNHYLPTLLEFCQPYQYGGKCFATVTGQRGSSALNAARNIGLRFLSRFNVQPTLVFEKVGNNKKAKLVKVGCDRVASKVSG